MSGKIIFHRGCDARKVGDFWFKVFFRKDQDVAMECA